jgi:hypothetical protein
VLISDEFKLALEAESAENIDTRPLRTRSLKDLGRVQMWKLIRAGSEPGADSRRTMRWERLGEVLRELDELRERGETAVGRQGGSAAVQPDGGDPVGS